jgi:hypothetical protein
VLLCQLFQSGGCVVWDILLPAFAAVLVLKQYTDVGLSGGDHAVDCFVPCVIHAGWGCAAIHTAHFGHTVLQQP